MTTDAKPKIADRIVAWDEWVEDLDEEYDEQARKPFEGGVMLAVATVLDAYDAHDKDRLRKGMSELRQTVEQVIHR